MNLIVSITAILITTAGIALSPKHTEDNTASKGTSAKDRMPT